MFDHDEVYEYPHPMAAYDEEKELALLRESFAELDAGKQGRPADEVFAEIFQELNRKANGKG